MNEECQQMCRLHFKQFYKSFYCNQSVFKMLLIATLFNQLKSCSMGNFRLFRLYLVRVIFIALNAVANRTSL